jgi:hypothetical protein
VLPLQFAHRIVSAEDLINLVADIRLTIAPPMPLVKPIAFEDLWMEAAVAMAQTYVISRDIFLMVK